MIKVLVSVSLVFVTLYCALVLFLYITQRAHLYFPNVQRPEPSADPEIVEVETHDDVALRAWYYAPRVEGRPVIVYFHGNAGHYGDRLYKAWDYIEDGYGVLLAEYRGYGGNEGSPSEDGLYSDGRAYIEWLYHEHDLDASDIVLYGESLGTGIATQMATEYDVKALILETPFSSMVELAQTRYFFAPVFLLLKDKYMSIDKIDDVNTPILIMHGHKDEVIPYEFARKLYDNAKEPKKFVDFPLANHNNLYEYGASQDVLEFLRGL
ncbi:MAG: alpha/beta hydrolase [Alphaproteobacteria bacterium]